MEFHKWLIKRAVKKILRIVLLPWRRFRRQRDGVVKTDGRHEIPNSVLLGMVRDSIREGHTATIWVKGFSMRPFLEHLRDKVLLSPVTRPLTEGDAVLAEITPNQYVLHRIIKIDGDNLTLMGDGNLCGTEQCKVQDVAGIVTEYIRPRRSFKADDPKLVRRVKLWRKLLPCRRLLLLVYKSII